MWSTLNTGNQPLEKDAQHQMQPAWARKQGKSCPDRMLKQLIAQHLRITIISRAQAFKQHSQVRMHANAPPASSSSPPESLWPSFGSG